MSGKNKILKIYFIHQSLKSFGKQAALSLCCVSILSIEIDYGFFPSFPWIFYLKMDSDHHRPNSFSFNQGSISNLPHHHAEESNMFISSMPETDDNEDDMLNDETFGDCDLETLKKKSDFGPNGEFLGNQTSLPAFFQPNNEPIRGQRYHQHHQPQQQDDQSHQPSIDALLGEDPMRFPTASMPRRTAPVNPLFSMAMSQAHEPHRPNAYLSQTAPTNARPPPLPPQPPQSSSHPQVHHQQQQQQLNYQLLKQFEQMLINKQVPPQERLIYIKAMMEKMQREALNSQQRQLQQQQTARVSVFVVFSSHCTALVLDDEF